MGLVNSKCYQWGENHIINPLISLHFSAKENLFLSTKFKKAHCLEKIGNAFLSGTQYFLNGKTIVSMDIAHDSVNMKFTFSKTDSTTVKVIKIVLAILTFIPALILGSIFKGLAFLSSDVRARHEALHKYLNAGPIETPEQIRQKYATMGIDELFSDEISTDLQHRPLGGPIENKASKRKEFKALKDVAAVFERYGIPYWMEYGSGLGVFRHSGFIPTDFDVDMAIPQPEHMNARRALIKHLDPKKYQVQDWSYDVMNSYLRVYNKKTRTHIDFHHHAIDVKKRTITHIYDAEDSMAPQWWKERERKFAKARNLTDVFPLRRAFFGLETTDEGNPAEACYDLQKAIDVRGPNDPKTCLKDYYGGKGRGRNAPDSALDPCKAWNPTKKAWVNVQGHTYNKENLF